MLELVMLGVLIGIAATLLTQDLIASVRDYQDRKQAEFEAIANSKAARNGGPAASGLEPGPFDWATQDI